jgi:hypothetical protein
MSAAIARLLPHASATSVASIESFVTIALFSGIGLLLSLAVLILDQYTPGEWFWFIGSVSSAGGITSLYQDLEHWPPASDAPVVAAEPEGYVVRMRPKNCHRYKRSSLAFDSSSSRKT